MVQCLTRDSAAIFVVNSSHKLQRHWLGIHGAEKQVIEIEKCKDKVRRCQLIARLRNLGNHQYHVEVLQKEEGKLMQHVERLEMVMQ